MLPILVILTPPLLLLWYVRWHDSEPEPIGRLWFAILVGGVVATSIIMGQRWHWLDLFLPSRERWSGDALLSWWIATLVVSFITAGLVEETVKIGSLLWLGRYFFDRGRPLAWITYGAAVGAGFATIENVGYSYYVDPDGDLITAAGRALHQVHPILGMAAGYLLSLRHQQPDQGRWLSLAFLLPIGLHGLNNFLLATLVIHVPAGATTIWFIMHCSAILILAGLLVGLALWIPKRACSNHLRLTSSSGIGV